MRFNNKGSSILLALVYAALGCVVIITMYTLLGVTISDTKTKSIKSTYTTFIANLRATLEDPHTCEVLLRGQPIGGNAPGSVNNNLSIGNSTPTYFPGGPIRSGWQSDTKDFTITRASLTTVTSFFRTLRLDKPSPDLLSYNVRINFTINVNGATPNRQFLATTNDSSNSHPEYEIDLIANVDPTGRIYSCHGHNSKAEACELAGGAYDGSADMNATPDLRCHPYIRCWVDKAGLKYTAASPLPAPAVPPTCTWPYSQVSWIGRIGAQDTWVCQWCNNQLWNPGVN